MHCCIVALGIGIDGTKYPLGVVEGSTENATVVTDLLTNLRERGLDVTRPVLVVIDGAKALAAAVKAVFDHPVIHRCQLHKIRNVEQKLPDALASTVAKKMRAAYRNPDALAAEADLEALARQLSKAHPGAAGMLEAAKQFRRVNGFLHLPALRAALNAHIARQTDTPIDYNEEDAA
jgi:putative transposase